MEKLKVYIASGWFSAATREILSKLESILDEKEGIEVYSPRRDGIMLPPNQKHDTALRESIFEENIAKITSSDLVIANIYSEDSYNDPGTMYEIGYAMAHDVPVIGFSTSKENLEERFKGILNGMTLVIGYEELISSLDGLLSLVLRDKGYRNSSKILFVGNGNDNVDERIVSYINEAGFNIRWVANMHDEVYSRIDEIFEDVDFLLTVVDDRKTLVSWMIGQAYSRGIPVITYSDQNYGINVMLLVSVLTHIRGKEELLEFLQKVKRHGLESIPKFDISQLDSM